jgi:hypothetical protein
VFAHLDAAADGVRAKGLSFFASKDELERRVSTCERDLDLNKFRAPARERLAAELITAYDSAHDFHCGCPLAAAPAHAPDEADCEVVASPRSSERHKLSCIYRPIACRSEGCGAVFSARHEARHDGACEWKAVPCTRGCDELIPRNGMAAHVDGPCLLKPVECPFAKVGCTVPCTQGSLAGHLHEHTAHHLGLTLGMITEQQRSLNGLSGVAAATAAATSALAAQAGALDALRARVDALESDREQRHARTQQAHAELRAALQRDLSHAASESGKRIDAVEKSVGKAHAAHAALDKASTSEIGRLKAAHEALRKTVVAVSERLAEGSR